MHFVKDFAFLNFFRKHPPHLSLIFNLLSTFKISFRFAICAYEKKDAYILSIYCRYHILYFHFPQNIYVEILLYKIFYQYYLYFIRVKQIPITLALSVIIEL